MNIKELKELFKLVEKFAFNEVEIVEGDFKVRIEKGMGHRSVATSVHDIEGMGGMDHGYSHDYTSSVQGSMASMETEQEIVEGEIVTSPFVGTFYRAPSPDSPSFVEVGQQVQKGQSLCIVEAMKLMNEIESEVSGKVVEIYIENGQGVEFGEKLFRIVSN
ncbi:MAG: acetyl-CoA carboxylase biotin carboxyl carrier protein [Bdellovibrionota bacterium]